MTLDGDLTVNSLSGVITPATISGNLNLGSVSRTFTINSTNSLPVAAVISANIGGAAGVDLVKAGQGTVLLSGNNTYAGQTYDSAGGLDIGSGTALGTGDLFIDNGTLEADSAPQTITNATFLDASLVIAGANALTFAGTANLEGNTTISITNSVYTYFSGGIGDSDGSQSLVEAGNGFLVLSGTNTYSGTTTINGGTLILNDDGTDINSTTFTVNSVRHLADRQ